MVDIPKDANVGMLLECVGHFVDGRLVEIVTKDGSRILPGEREITLTGTVYPTGKIDAATWKIERRMSDSSFDEAKS